MSATSDVFSALLFPQQHQANTHYLQQQLGQIQARPAYDSIQAQWFRQAEQDLQRTLSQEALIKARQIRQEYDITSVMSTEIMRLNTLEQLQTAPVVMMPYLMACPEVREYYHQGHLSGYAGVYVDQEPQYRGWKHVDYQVAVDGLALENDEGQVVVEQFFSDQVDDRRLNLFQQADIQVSWDVMRAWINHGEDDPTSVGGELIN